MYIFRFTPCNKNKTADFILYKCIPVVEIGHLNILCYSTIKNTAELFIRVFFLPFNQLHLKIKHKNIKVQDVSSNKITSIFIM